MLALADVSKNRTPSSLASSSPCCVDTAYFGKEIILDLRQTTPGISQAHPSLIITLVANKDLIDAL